MVGKGVPIVGVVIDGIVPVLPVPFLADGALDEPGLAALVGWAAENGAQAVCLPAYGGEFYKLTEPERVRVVEIATAAAEGRVPVIGQANHASQRAAIQLAREMESVGAAMISMAAPRTFGLSDADLVRYFEPICREIDTELLIQDFNPGGATVGASFAARLRRSCPNFRYLKLEDPMMGPRVRAIREATDGEVGVLEGWGGMYLPELMDAGICGVMPGLTVLPALEAVFRGWQRGDRTAAFTEFQSVLPWIVFELQHMELFLHLEKRMLCQAGLIATSHVREATIALDPDTDHHGRYLIDYYLPRWFGSPV